MVALNVLERLVFKIGITRTKKERKKSSETIFLFYWAEAEQ